MTITFGAGSLVGAPVRRVEDPTLLRGEGTYVDNLDLPACSYLAFVRSPMAHVQITGIERKTPARMPGVVAVYAPTISSSPTAPGSCCCTPRGSATRWPAAGCGSSATPWRPSSPSRGAGRRRRGGRDRRLRPAPGGDRHRSGARARRAAAVRGARHQPRRMAPAGPTRDALAGADVVVRAGSRTSASRWCRWRATRSRCCRATTATATTSPCTSRPRCRTRCDAVAKCSASIPRRCA